jgi:hypothetical protein
MQLQPRRVYEALDRHLEHHGLIKTLIHVVYRLTNCVATMLIFRVVVLELGNMDWSLVAGPDDRWGFLNYDELRRFAKQDPSFGLDDNILAAACSRGDRCYGFVENGVLGACTWYATCQNPLTTQLRVHFPRDYIYMYRAFTAKAFRGRRLYSIGVTRAMDALSREMPCKGLICCIQEHNWPSRKGLGRIGAKTIGRAIVLGGKCPRVCYSSPGSRPLFHITIQSSETLG